MTNFQAFAPTLPTLLPRVAPVLPQIAPRFPSWLSLPSLGLLGRSTPPPLPIPPAFPEALATSSGLYVGPLQQFSVQLAPGLPSVLIPATSPASLPLPPPLPTPTPAATAPVIASAVTPTTTSPIASAASAAQSAPAVSAGSSGSLLGTIGNVVSFALQALGAFSIGYSIGRLLFGKKKKPIVIIPPVEPPPPTTGETIRIAGQTWEVFAKEPETGRVGILRRDPNIIDRFGRVWGYERKVLTRQQYERLVSTPDRPVSILPSGRLTVPVTAPPPTAHPHPPFAPTQPSAQPSGGFFFTPQGRAVVPTVAPPGIDLKPFSLPVIDLATGKRMVLPPSQLPPEWLPPEARPVEARPKPVPIGEPFRWGDKVVAPIEPEPGVVYRPGQLQVVEIETGRRMVLPPPKSLGLSPPAYEQVVRTLTRTTTRTETPLDRLFLPRTRYLQPTRLRPGRLGRGIIRRLADYLTPSQGVSLAPKVNAPSLAESLSRLADTVATKGCIPACEAPSQGGAEREERECPSLDRECPEGKTLKVFCAGPRRPLSARPCVRCCSGPQPIGGEKCRCSETSREASCPAGTVRRSFCARPERAGRRAKQASQERSGSRRSKPVRRTAGSGRQSRSPGGKSSRSSRGPGRSKAAGSAKRAKPSTSKRKR